MIHFSRVEPLRGSRWLHADGETKGVKPERVVISFGPEHAPSNRVQVEHASKRPTPSSRARKSSSSPPSNSIPKPPKTSTNSPTKPA